jgi:hypothetical protein
MAMAEICTTHADEYCALHIDRMQPEPEDVFFAKMCLKKYKVPTFEEAQEFASEEVMCMHSLGFHKVYGYHSIEHVKAFFDAALNATCA